MADEKKKPAKAQDDAKQVGKSENKVIAWFKALPKRIATPFKNMANELKRVTWPSKEKLIRYSIIVLLFVLAMMIIIGLFDLGSSSLIDVIRGKREYPDATATDIATVTDVATAADLATVTDVVTPTDVTSDTDLAAGTATPSDAEDADTADETAATPSDAEDADTADEAATPSDVLSEAGFVGEWKSEDGQALTLNEDGTFAFGEKSGTWTLAEDKVTLTAGDETETVLQVEEDGTLSLTNEETGEKTVFALPNNG